MRLLASVLMFACSIAFAAGTPTMPHPSAQPALRFIESNGIRMRIAEMGSGPLVIFVHGWPESWYSWRHQLPAIAAAGYRVVAPDMRGYGQTDKPAAVEDYDIQHVTGDLVGILDALGEKQAILVGHDWGAIVTWHAMLLHPDRFTALVAMSVPYNGRGAVSLVEGLRRSLGDNFFYILYFQEPGAAEQEFDADPRGILSRLYLSPGSPREAPQITDPKRAAGGWIPRLGAPKGLPSWLTQADLDYYVNEFTAAGFRGGINYYRNFQRNWDITPQLANAKVTQPVLFLAGEKDTVIRGASAEALTNGMKNAVPGLTKVMLMPDTGHWIQQERPEETNAAILAFLASLKK
ncbi:MAG TPA: alpha/beta hydrolase [Povalibacter sp.]|uniref:alpha/beta fold hydrolase n=1 Tax=Povalibacter sp. TaxID=1962978 RepID=UPI002BBBCE8E|nr:alpha/beta hydrolase [Povalibacter sp.]HMN46382.1 alpha/beta hydrolase [Povalibacter sp.]